MRIKRNDGDAKPLGQIPASSVIRDDDGGFMLVTADRTTGGVVVVDLIDGETYTYSLTDEYPIVDGAFVEGA